jgi:SAM-dependent methyltransferase
MTTTPEAAQAAAFFDTALRQVAGLSAMRQARVLDFGCGEGDLMRALAELGYTVSGCDVRLYGRASNNRAIGTITTKPYHIPFDDNSFDAVVSTSVLEHAQNPHEYMPEIARVLRPGGCALHLFPARHYLPYEPHIYVPLVNFFWPRQMRWWVAMWAMLGRRNEFQGKLGWRKTCQRNLAFIRNRTIYMSTRQYDELSRRYYASHQWPMAFYVMQSEGGFAAIARRIPLPRLWGFLSREFRMAFLVQRKADTTVPSGVTQALVDR